MDSMVSRTAPSPGQALPRHPSVLAPSTSSAPAFLVLVSLLGTLWTAGHLWHAAQAQHRLRSSLEETTHELLVLRNTPCDASSIQGSSDEVLRLEQRVHDLSIRSEQATRELRRERARSEKLLGTQATAVALRGATNNQPDGGGSTVLCFVAVLSHPGRSTLRDTLRATWFPTGEQRVHVERDLGLVFRFVIGQSTGGAAASKVDAAVLAEAKLHRDVMVVQHPERAVDLASKTLLAMDAAVAAYGDARFFVKVDDDVWLSPPALATVLSSRLHHVNRGYIGCFVEGGSTRSKVEDGHRLQYADPDPAVSYSVGQAYVLSLDLVRTLVNAAYALRRGAREDLTVASWLFGLQHDQINDERFCCAACGGRDECVVIHQAECNGLCDPEVTLPKLFQLCSNGTSEQEARRRSEQLLRGAAKLELQRRRDAGTAPKSGPNT
jgi:hypothetical protein